MILPGPLAPWAAQLGIFGPLAIEHLGPWVQRLGAAIEGVAVRPSAGGGEPDGFDGLSQRGDYQRLVMTEWALAEDFPDEFLRRAAMGEHLFLRLARQEPTGAKWLTVLFDAGPDQLGAPRLAQLAALAVLSRRADRLGYGLRWGVAQDFQADWEEGLDRDGVRYLLASRCDRDVDGDDLTARPLDDDPSDERWLVGGRRLLRTAPMSGQLRLAIVDPHAAGGADAGHCLEVELARDHTRLASLELAVPASTALAAVLDDPFAAERQLVRWLPRRIDGARLTLMEYGRKVAVRLGSERALVLPIDPMARCGKVLGPVEGTLLAIGWNRGSKQPTGLVRSHDGTLRLVVGVGRGAAESAWFQACDEWVSAQDQAALPELLRFRPVSQNHRWEACALDGAGNLFTLGPGRLMPKVARVIAAGMFSQAWSPDRIEVLARLDGATGHFTYGRGEGNAANRSTAAISGSFVHVGANQAPGVALETEPDVFAIETSWQRIQLVVPHGVRRVGVVAHRDGLALVVIEADDRTVAFLGLNFVRRLPPTTSPIVDAVVSWHQPLLVYLCSDGAIVAHDYYKDKPRMAIDGQVLGLASR